VEQWGNGGGQYTWAGARRLKPAGTARETQAGRQAGWQTSWLADKLAGRQAGWLADNWMAVRHSCNASWGSPSFTPYLYFCRAAAE
jgi:hypothetical protein